MRETLRLVRVFVASPSDVADERDAVQRVVDELNAPDGFAEQQGCVLKVLDWRHVTSGMGRPEDVILDALQVGTWDIFVGILWARFGSPPHGRDSVTDRPYDSGSEEEFWLAYRSWQEQDRPDLWFFRKTAPVPPNLDPNQSAKVQQFFKGFEAIGAHPGI